MPITEMSSRNSAPLLRERHGAQGDKVAAAEDRRGFLTALKEWRVPLRLQHQCGSYC